MSEAKTALDLAGILVARQQQIEGKYPDQGKSMETLVTEATGARKQLQHIPADAPEQIERLTKDIEQINAGSEYATSRIMHMCQLLGVDFCCEEPETCEQVIERVLGELNQLRGALRDEAAAKMHAVDHADKAERALAQLEEETETHAALDEMKRERDEERAKREKAEGDLNQGRSLWQKIEASLAHVIIECDDERAKRKEAEAAQAAMGTLLASITDHGPLQRFGSNNPSRLLEWIILIRVEARALLNKLNVGEEAPRITRIMEAAEELATFVRTRPPDHIRTEATYGFIDRATAVCKAVRGEEKP